MSLPPFRVLEGELGPANALWLWWVVWRELAYFTEEGLAPGRIRNEDRPAFVAAINVPGQENIRARGDARPPDCWELLVRSRLLKADGTDWVCPRFANLHGAACMPRNQAQRGGDMRAYSLRQRKAPGEAFQQALLIAESKMVDEHNEPLDPETRQRVVRLIVSCDNALFKNARPTHGYSEGLVQDALKVLRRFTDEEINRVCNFVASRRNHPMLTTTEKLLPQFGEIVQIVEGQN
ncbi:MAG TPA: hypothetical protein VMU04_24690 [Candidatus Acidoferrum sp.]|nr:hypothetical protein [Candidatus Acidoferrum sp.]